MTTGLLKKRFFFGCPTAVFLMTDGLLKNGRQLLITASLYDDDRLFNDRQLVKKRNGFVKFVPDGTVEILSRTCQGQMSMTCQGLVSDISFF